MPGAMSPKVNKKRKSTLQNNRDCQIKFELLQFMTESYRSFNRDLNHIGLHLQTASIISSSAAVFPSTDLLGIVYRFHPTARIAIQEIVPSIHAVFRFDWCCV